VNDYRQGDNAAYLFRTRDLGKSWQRIVDDTDVWGYLLCFVQDPVEPGLMFAGTEYGLYVSFDEGTNWNRWTSGYPTVSTYDMVIQPRERDLVIGTFGRAVWILDDIRPLRALAADGRNLLGSRLTVFDPPVAYLASTKNLPGYYFYGDAMYRGQNREPGAMISYYTSAGPGKVTVEIKDESGNKVRSMEAEASMGFNRLSWRLDRDPLPQLSYPRNQAPQQDQRQRYYRNFGGMVFPGNYTVTLSMGEEITTTVLKVNPDPRMEAPDSDALKRNYERALAFGNRVEALNEKLLTITQVRETLAKTKDIMDNDPGFAQEISDLHKTVSEDVAKLDEAFNRRPDGLLSRINGYRAVVMTSEVSARQEEKAFNDTASAMEEAEKITDAFITGSWEKFRDTLSNLTLQGDLILIKPKK
jgi:hypothetical protein